MKKTNMQARRLLIAWVMVCCGAMAAAQPPAGSTWEMTFFDDFLGSALDQTKWNVGYGWGRTTGWTQEYIADDHVLVQNGLLRLKQSNTAQNGKPYTAGAVNSKGKFTQKYGYFEARIKMNTSYGMHFGWWAKQSDDDWPPELDIMELVAREPWRYTNNIHYLNDAGTKYDLPYADQQANSINQTLDYHVYGCEWRPDAIIFYVDTKERRRITDPTILGYFHRNAGAPNYTGGDPFYLLLNVHIGHDWAGYPNSTTVWPNYMEVDYVKVYKRVSSTTPVNLIKNGEFDNGTTDWNFYQYTGTTASLAAVTGEGLSGTNAGRVYIDNGGTADWHVSVGQALPISSGKTYQISFMTKAGASRQVRVGIQQNGGSNTLYWDEPVTVGTTATTHTFTFTAPATDATTALRFFTGGNTTDLIFDKVVVTDGATAPALLVKNPEFDNGTTDWSMYNYTGATSTLAVVTNQALSGTNAAKISIAAGSQGTADWHISMGQTIGITSGKTYRISFMSRASSARTIRVGIQGSDNTVYWDQTVTIGTTGTTYGPYSFTASVTDATAALRFFVGGNDLDVNLDKIIVTDGATARSSFEGNHSGESSLNVFPNPARDRLTISYTSPADQPLRITLQDVHSRHMQEKTASVKKGDNQIEMNVQALKTGMYFVEVRPASGGAIVKKVLITR